MADVVVSEVRSHHHGPAGRLLIASCKAFAVGAGVLLIFMAAMSLASIVGRTFLGKPILGDYELVQVLCAAAVSMALPYCQLGRGHVIVDFFTTRASKRVVRTLDVAAGPPAGALRLQPPTARALVRPRPCDQPGAACGASAQTTS